MTKIDWDLKQKIYLSGVEKGVLYPLSGDGVAWNGLVSIDEESENFDVESLYVDGNKYTLTHNRENVNLTLSAYTYPEEFLECSGFDEIYGLQDPKSFGLSYLVGDDKTGQVHLVYNILAKPSTFSRNTINDGVSIELFSWDLFPRSSESSISAPTSHVIIDLSLIYQEVKDLLFDILYGSISTNPRLPTLEELINLFHSHALFVVVDNGDGTWTATGPDECFSFLDETTFKIDTPSARLIDYETYEISTY